MLNPLTPLSINRLHLTTTLKSTLSDPFSFVAVHRICPESPGVAPATVKLAVLAMRLPSFDQVKVAGGKASDVHAITVVSPSVTTTELDGLVWVFLGASGTKIINILITKTKTSTATTTASSTTTVAATTTASTTTAATTTRKEMFYLTMHSTHFIYGYIASDSNNNNTNNINNNNINNSTLVY